MMKRYVRAIAISLIFLLALAGCSGDSEEEAATPAIADDIIGAWASTDVTAGVGGVWQFYPDGTFIDTENATFQYKIQTIDGFHYISYNVDELGIELTDEVEEELMSSLGEADFIPIYQVQMPSIDSLVLEPASRLYGSNSYFGIEFQTYVLRRQ